MSATGRRTAGPAMRAAPDDAVVPFVAVVRPPAAGAILASHGLQSTRRSGTDTEPAEPLMTTLTA